MDENEYDKWKTECPAEEPDNSCEMCGAPCEKEFCSEKCRKEWFDD